MIPVPKRLLIIAVVIVVVIVAVALAFPNLLSGKVLATTIIVQDSSGAYHTLVNQNSAALLTIGGYTVNAVQFYTNFTGSSSGYSAFTLTQLGSFVLASPLPSGVIPAPSGTGSGVQLWTTQNVQGLNVVRVCGSLAGAIPSSVSQSFKMGTTYSMGALLSANPYTFNVLSATILGWSAANGCPGVGNYQLSYSVQLNAQAVGSGSVPTATWTGYWNLGVSISTGSMTLLGTISSSTNAVTPTMSPVLWTDSAGMGQ